MEIKMNIKWGKVIAVLLNIILLVSFFFYFKNKNYEYKNNDIIEKLKRYESQIDSIKKEIDKRDKIIHSLNDTIEINDVLIKNLLYIINSLKNEKIKIKGEYENRDNELKKMSNDSIVIYVREQLLLWTEYKW